MFHPNDAIMFAHTNGSVGKVIKPNHYGGIYVTFYYGKDIANEDITTTTSVKPDDLIKINNDLFNRYINCQAWSPEQKVIRKQIIQDIEKHHGD